MSQLCYTAEEIHEINESRIYCIICGGYIDDCHCHSCESYAKKKGCLTVGEREVEDLEDTGDY